MKKIVLLIAALTAVITSAARNSYIFLAPGFDEIEALTTVDVLRRANMDVVTVAVGDSKNIPGSTGITIMADSLLSEINPECAEWLILPGGEDGVKNLHENALVNKMLLKQAKHKGGIAAICAAPARVLAPLKILEGRSCTCYPGMSKEIYKYGGDYTAGSVVVDSEIVTSEGPATTLPFACEIIRLSRGEKTANLVAQAMLSRY